MSIREKVEEVLAQVRPVLQADGGDVELVDVTEDNEVHVRMQGRCKGCPMSQLTLAMTIESTIKEQIPEIIGVKAVD